MYAVPEIDPEAARRYNADRNPQIDGPEAIADFQASEGITIDGKWGPETLAHWRACQMSCPVSKPDEDKIVNLIAQFEGTYWAVNRDGEYRGLFGEDFWAYQDTHLGLSFGFLQFNQRAGSLGELLKAMRQADAGCFDEIFVYPDKLLDVTNRAAGQTQQGRNRRVQPVAGADLWEEPWVGRFQEAGRQAVFQQVQRDYAKSEYMAPSKETAKMLDVRSERALAMIFDRSIQNGPTGARNLFEALDDHQPEHVLLYDALKTWQGKSWHHRPHKLFFHRQLKDT